MEITRQDFISNASHEIKSPLTSIQGFTVLLKMLFYPWSINGQRKILNWNVQRLIFDKTSQALKNVLGEDFLT